MRTFLTYKDEVAMRRESGSNSLGIANTKVEQSPNYRDMPIAQTESGSMNYDSRQKARFNSDASKIRSSMNGVKVK